MIIIRAIPRTIPEGRNYVVDQIDTVEMDNYDMHFLSEMDDDVILLEWDIAVAFHDIHNFVSHCRQAPHLIHVAPYVLYETSLDELHAPVWAHRDFTHDLNYPLQLRWIDYGDPVCDIFSTGMVYLPLPILKRLRESDELITWHDNITDSKLAFWYHHTFKEKVPVHWDVRPIHLHYSLEEIYESRDISRLGATRRSRLESRESSRVIISS